MAPARIERDGDDLLFSIVRANELQQHEMRGYGVNDYYHQPFGAGDFLFTYMLLSMASSPGGRYYYQTTPTGYDNLDMAESRVPKLRGVSRPGGPGNTEFFGRQASFAGSRYTQASRSVSASRQRYMSSQRSTGAFKTSGTSVRSARAVSGFMGGGGAGPLRLRVIRERV